MSGVVEEGDLPTEPMDTRWRFTVDGLIEGHLRKLWDRLTSHVREQMEARRYQDGTGDADYNRRLRELEGQIAEIDRDQHGLRMGDYHEGGGDKWNKWAMPGLVTLAVSGIIGNVAQAMAVSALRQEVTDLKAEVERVEKLVAPRYRGSP
jgi:hypothetical protein